jgi:hypothetical protein
MRSRSADFEPRSIDIAKKAPSLGGILGITTYSA